MHKYIKFPTILKIIVFQKKKIVKIYCFLTNLMNISHPSTAIYVETEKPFYYPGDTVNGHIFLNFEMSSFPGNQLFLKIKGKEQTSWTAPNPNTPSQLDKKTGLVIFYNHKFEIFKWEEGFVPAGQYDFPFSFNLKDFLPGSYSHKPTSIEEKQSQTCAVIRYKIKAECLNLNAEQEMSKIKTDKEILVREKLKVNIFSKGEISLPMISCCCIPQGSCQIRCYFEKNAYECGENANVFCEIDNVNGSLGLQNVSFELKSHIILRSDNGDVKEMQQTIAKHEMQGLTAGQKAEGPTKKSINFFLGKQGKSLSKDFEEVKGDLLEPELEQLQESSGGQLVNCSYFLEVTAKADGIFSCTPPKMTRIPVMIFKKPKGPRKIDGEWNPKVMQTIALVVNEANFYRKGNKNKNN